MDGLESGSRNAQALGRAMAGIGDVLLHAPDAHPKYLSWRGLLEQQATAPDEWRQYVTLMPRLDYGTTSPALAATQAIRDAARRLDLDAAHGIRVRLTGSSVIADEELASLAESSGLIAGLMLLCMVAVLYAATRSARIIAAILLTTATGAVLTAAIGLVLVGRFTLISIAFLPLFAGLGIDFCIQLHARAGAEPAMLPLHARLHRAAGAIGNALILAALAIAAAFFAFLPTAYRGISELGLISGAGILVAFLLSLTLLPAMLVLLGAPIREEATPRMLQGIDGGLRRRHRAVLWGAALLAVVAGAALPKVRTNFDPMVLRNPRSEAVSTYYELARKAGTTPDTVSALAEDPAAAVRLARRIAALPEVGSVTTVQSLVPEDQDQKLALIGEARDLLDLSLNPFTTLDPPADAGIVAALRRTAERLRAIGGTDAALRASPRALAAKFESLADADRSRRDHATLLLMKGLPTALAQISASLTAEPVTVASLPAFLRRQWLAPDGTARLEVAPAAPLLDSTSTARFVAAVRSVLPTAAGDAVTIAESRHTILGAFLWAGLLSAASISALLWLALRSIRGVVLALLPVVLAGVLAFGACALIGVTINLENLIALPLLLGIGVAFNVYCVSAWHSGGGIRVESSLGRGILFSALTTGTSFTTLIFSSHPGTSSMGALLLIALGCIVATSLLVTPALAARLKPT
ncbi:MAG TPA: MMPL family transporter, partial [Steroidobacteraceae bacterium]|nr:MMPL family transporter [Steroidobacteraceae bacterium]